MTTRARAALALVLLVLAPITARSQAPPSPGSIIERVGFDQKLGAQVPLDLTFHDETGQTVRLKDLMRPNRPVVLALVYYNCPMLCTQVLNGLTRGLKPLALELGSDFDIITVSIDPKDTPELAGRKKASYLGLYGREGREAGWHFLTGAPPAIEALAAAVGFRYTFNPGSGQYAHAAGVVVLTPDGRAARYFYGIEFAPRDLQFGLMEASAGRVGSAISRAMLLCYDYDAATGKYTLSILRLSQALSVATALGLAGMVAYLLRRERRSTPKLAHPATP